MRLQAEETWRILCADDDGDDDGDDCDDDNDDHLQKKTCSGRNFAGIFALKEENLQKSYEESFAGTLLLKFFVRVFFFLSEKLKSVNSYC